MARTFNLRFTMLNKTDPVIEVRGLCKKVKDATGELTILDNIDLAIASRQQCRDSRRVRVGQVYAARPARRIGQRKRRLGSSARPASSTTLNEDERAALRSGSVGFVFQSFQLMPHLTALENVTLPLELQGGIGTMRARCARAALLEQVGLGQRTRSLSGSCCRAASSNASHWRARSCTHPAILFADEPTGSLDAATGHAMRST